MGRQSNLKDSTMKVFALAILAFSAFAIDLDKAATASKKTSAHPPEGELKNPTFTTKQVDAVITKWLKSHDANNDNKFSKAEGKKLYTAVTKAVGEKTSDKDFAD